MKRVISLFLTAIMILSVMPMTGFAASFGSITGLPSGWEIENVESYSNGKYFPYASPVDISMFIYKDILSEFKDKPMTILKAPFTDKDSDTFKGNGDYASFTIDKTAEIYLVLGGGFNPQAWSTSGSNCLQVTPPSWVEEDGWEPIYIDSAGASFGNHNGVLLQGSSKVSADYAVGGQIMRPYKKSVMVEDGETKTIKLKGMQGGSNLIKLPYVIFIKWMDTADITFNISAGGKVLDSSNNEVNSGTENVIAGNTVSYKAIPDSGYYVKKVVVGTQEKGSSFDEVDFSITPTVAGENVTVEFSNSYDFSSNAVLIEAYTDENDLTIKQKLKVKGQVSDFMKGKTLKVNVSNGVLEENFSGVIDEDGSYEISNNTTLSGAVTVKINLEINPGLEVEVIEEEKTIESVEMVNSFIDKVKDIENYSDEAFISDLETDGESFGFDTEIFVQMSETQKVALIDAIKENFAFISLEKLIEKYDELIPVYAVSNAENSGLIVNAVEKYADELGLKEHQVKTNVYNLYNSSETFKTEIAEKLTHKSFTKETFSKALLDNVLFSKIMGASDEQTARGVFDNNISYFTLTNKHIYTSYASAKKDLVFTEVFGYEEPISDFDKLNEVIDESILAVKSDVPENIEVISGVPDGWEVENIDSFEDNKYIPYVNSNAKLYLYGDIKEQFASKPMIMVKAPESDKDSENFLSSGEYASFELNQSAEVYIGIGGGVGRYKYGNEGYVSSIKAPAWMEADGWEPVTVVASNGKINEALIEGSMAEVIRIYRKHFIIKPGETKKIVLKGIAGSEKVVYPYIIFMETKINADIDFSINEGGKILDLKGNEISSGKKTVFGKTTYTYKVDPNPGYYVKKISFGKTEIESSLSDVLFDITPSLNGESVKVEFSDSYDFSSNQIKTKVYTDESGDIKQKLILSGKVADFMAGKTLKVTLTDESSVSETFSGEIEEDGSYELSTISALSGNVNILTKLETEEGVEVEVIDKTERIEPVSKVLAFINKCKTMNSYSSEDFADDLEADGEFFGFDTEIFNKMSNAQKLSLIGAIKEGFIFESLEKLIEKYESLIPVYAVSNADKADLIVAALEKYASDLELKKDDKYGKVYAMYEADSKALKKEAAEDLTGKSYINNLSGFKTDLCDNIIFTEFSHTENYTEIGTLIDNNLIYLNLTNAAVYRGFSRARKNDTFSDIMVKKAAATNYLSLKALIDSCIKNNQSSSSSGGSGGGGGMSGGGGGKNTVYVSPELPKVNESISTVHGFNDVPADFWATEAISYLVKEGILDNKTGVFNPQKAISRTEFTKLIISAYGLLEETEERTEGEEIEAEFPFTDIKADSEEAKYILSAKNLGIITGVSEEEFGGDKNITRQDACVIILRTLNAIETVPDIEAGTLKFADSKMVSNYAMEAVSLLSACGIVKGDGENFMPLNNISNAETAQLIYNLRTNKEVLKSYFESVVKKEYEVLGDKAAGASNETVDYGFNQGGIEASFIEEPKPHPVPGVINILYKNNYLYMAEYPFIEDGRTLAPVRCLEHFGMSVEWNGEESLVTVKKNESEIKIKIGEKTALVNDEERTLDVAAKIVNGRTYVPMRFIAEALNMKVEWDDEEKTVILK